MSMNQVQLRAFLGGFGLTAIILLTTSVWAFDKRAEPIQPNSITWVRI